MSKLYNFSAGPALLPHPVLAEAQAQMFDWHGSGLSVMEMSHRGREFMEIIHDAEADLRELLNVPAGYKVLFLQGGASQQFAMVPLNLMGEGGHADYIDSGHWSRLAIKEARRYGRVDVIASSEASAYTTVPQAGSYQGTAGASYLHYTSNETINGVEFPYIPESAAPLVCDMSSDFLSGEIDVSRFGLIYAGAQKNIGPSGMVVVVVREDLLGHALPATPTMLDYRVHADADSMYNTPPTWPIYIAGLVFKWLKAQGGLRGIAALNSEKAGLLYHAIDGSGGFYRAPVAVSARSQMNVVFRLSDDALDEAFLAGAKKAGLVQLKGHRVAGGMRASIYNAMPVEGVKALVGYMQEFARQHG